MGRRRSTDGLIKSMDAAAGRLLKRITKDNLPAPNGGEGGEPGTPSVEPNIAESVAAFNAVRAWVQVKHKIDPDDEPTDFVRKNAHVFGGEQPKRRASRHRRSPPPAEDTGGSDLAATTSTEVN